MDSVSGHFQIQFKPRKHRAHISNVHPMPLLPSTPASHGPWSFRSLSRAGQQRDPKPSPLSSWASWKSQIKAKRLKNRHHLPVRAPPLGTRLPGACRKEGWDAHFCSPWQRVKRAGRSHWHQHWKKASTHLRWKKKKIPSLTRNNTPWFPTNWRVPGGKQEEKECKRNHTCWEILWLQNCVVQKR